MKRQLSKVLLFIVTTLFYNAHAEIPLTQLKGLDTCMTADCQQFAPAYGTLFWYSGLPKNLWLFGDEQSSMATLVRHLFYVQEDGSFDKTHSPMFINFFFTPSDIGTIVSIIYKHQNDALALEQKLQEYIQTIVKTRAPEIKKAIVDSLTRTQERLSATIQESKVKIINQIPETVRQQFVEFLRQGKTDKASFKEVMRALGLDKKLQETIEQNLQVPLNTRAKNQKQLDDEAKSTTALNEFLLKDAGLIPDTKPNFVQAILGALDEEKKSLFPEGTVTNFFLALLWKLGNSRNDVKQYLDSLARGLQIPANEVFAWRDGASYDLNYYKSLKEKTEQEIMTMDIGDLIFARYGYDYYENILPPLVSMIDNAHYKDPLTNMIIKFPDCGETSLRNFFNFLIYCVAKQLFESELFEKLSEHPSPALIAFYKKYNTPELILSNQAHDDWPQVVSNLPNVQYRNGTCNISSDTGMQNMLAVINNLLPGISSWEILEERLNTLGIDISIIPEKPLAEQPIHNTLTIVLTKPGKISVTFRWQFVPGHFSLEVPGTLSIEHGQIYKNALNKRIKEISPSNISERWPLIMMFSSFDFDGVTLSSMLNSSLIYPSVLLFKILTLENRSDLARKAVMALYEEQNPLANKYLCSIVLNVYKKLPKDFGLITHFYYEILAHEMPSCQAGIDLYKELFENAKKHLVVDVKAYNVHLLKAMLSMPEPATRKSQYLYEQIINYAIKLSRTIKDDEVKESMEQFLAAKLHSLNCKSTVAMELIHKKCIIDLAIYLLAAMEDDNHKAYSIGHLITIPIPTDPALQELIKPLFQAIVNSIKTIKYDNQKVRIMLWISNIEIFSDKKAQEMIKPILDEELKLLDTLNDDCSKKNAISYITRFTTRFTSDNYRTDEKLQLVKPFFIKAAQLFSSIQDPELKQKLTDEVIEKMFILVAAPEAKTLANILRKAAELKPLE